MTERFFIQTDEVSGIEVPVSDRGLQYGDGFFETLRISDGKCALLPFHSERIKETAEALKFMPDSVTHVPAELLSQLGGENGVLRITFTRGEGPRGYRYPSAPELSRHVSAFSVFRSVQANQPESFSLTVCRHRLSRQPALAGFKHLNRLDQVMGRSEWADEFHEGLMLNQDEHVIEGTMSNVFWISAGRIFTPRLKQEGVNGVVRRWLLSTYDVIEKDAALGEVLNANEIFMTNSVIGIMPVSRIETEEYTIGPVTTKIRGDFNTFLTNN